MADGEAKARDYNLERLIFLSDGVFAIAITLLAIELHPPEGWDGTLVGLINGTFRQFIAFGISFLFIAIYWASHRRTYQRFQRADGMLTALNFVVLALITLTPFFTSLIADHGPQGEPLLIYMGLVVAVGVASALQWGYAAFIGRDILSSPMGFPLKLLIFLILLIVPAAMALMGLVASRPEAGRLTARVCVALCRDDRACRGGDLAAPRRRPQARRLKTARRRLRNRTGTATFSAS